MNFHLLTAHGKSLFVLSLISASAFVISLVLIPFVVERLPEDFFLKKNNGFSVQSPLFFRSVLFLIKNMAGILLFCAGLVMLFLPGQGLLTMLLGLGLMNFPCKKTLSRKLLQLPSVQNLLNWIRRRKALTDFKYP